MNHSNVNKRYQSEEDLFMCDISDEALEAAGNVEKAGAENITWYHCPTGLTLCRF
jgi:hypothetical protein